MPIETFSKEDIMEDHEAAAKFLGFLEKNSYGYIPHDWSSNSTTDIQRLAVEFWDKVENEINVLEYFRTTNYLLN